MLEDTCPRCAGSPRYEAPRRRAGDARRRQARRPGSARRGRAEPAEPDALLLGAVAAAMALVKAYRMHGHLAARLDPLGSEPMGDPALDETRLVPAADARAPGAHPGASSCGSTSPGETLLEALPRLREVYTGSIAYEIEHISDHAERVWLRQAIESGRFRAPARARASASALLRRLSQVEGFEQYLRRSFLGQKQFSLEGLDVADPDARRGDRARGARAARTRS